MTVTLLSDTPDISALKVRHVQKDSALLVSPPLAGHEGPIFGDIFICEDQLYFYSESSKSGIAVQYPDIVIHAASRQEGQPNIYCQLDSGIFFPNQRLPEDDQELQEAVTEIRLIPRDSSAVEGIYMTMSDCAALHPDPEFAAEQEQEFFANPSDETELDEIQQAALRHLETVFESKPNGQHNPKEGQ